jgi:hypothetical protein
MNLRLTLLCLAITASARAEVRVAGIFSDQMHGVMHVCMAFSPRVFGSVLADSHFA